MWGSYSFRKEVVSRHPVPNIAHEDAYRQSLQGWSDLVCQPHQLTLEPVLSSGSADHGRPTQSLIAGSKLRSVSKMAGIIATTMTLSLVLICMCLPAVYTSPIEITRTGEVEAGKFGAVASESELCSRYGSDMLKKGGSAADSVSLPWPYILYCFCVLELTTGSWLQPPFASALWPVIIVVLEEEDICWFGRQIIHTSISTIARRLRLLLLRTCSRATRTEP